MLNSNRQSTSSIIRYSSIPTAPVIEDSPYSVSMVRNPPPYSPPLPPQTENAKPLLTRFSRRRSEKARQWRQCDINIIRKVALFEGLIAGKIN
ncbi:unnamed protein product [Onchocerca ochengi]|uniref:Uncharacterized protein n=1 Tax=Onchocerca ochengi TaxID=42157 RepID=A0A182ERS0_ONCOC|nr:unnamed protein product [Onchocerca ochengi]